jgi:hypothetical protein
MSEWIEYIESPRLAYCDTPYGGRLWRSHTGHIAVELRPIDVQMMEGIGSVLRGAVTDQTPPPETEKPKRRKK